MAQTQRPPLIAGNWKMNPDTADEAEALAKAVMAGMGPAADVHVAIAPAFVHLQRIDLVLDGSPIGLAAQDMHWMPSGAYTGEISAAMLQDAGCTHVILGHSERRHGMGETDADVNRKLHAALAAKLIPIVCVGETRAEREADKTRDVVSTQLDGSLAGLDPDRAVGVVIAYEPVWAIGTGLNATPEQAQEVHAFIRGKLSERLGAATAARVVVLYGGSVKPDNAADLIGKADVDGALVGGASLKAEDFLAIIAAARTATTAKRGSNR